jgi:acetyl-CoA carboxylase biotin carboxyl carrier protein
MEWSERKILDTLRMIEESDYDEVRLETENFRLHVRKSGAPAQLGNAGTPAAVTPPPHADSAAPVAAPQAAAPSASREEVAVPPGMVAVRAPMIGTFYRAPAPHLAPFVEEGAAVNVDDTVCLVEVMKLFNTIKAGVAGKVVRIMARNATPVQRDEILMIIEPRDRSGGHSR